MSESHPRPLFSIHKEFELLVGLRDGKLTHVAQLTTSQSEHKTVACAEYLDAIGLVSFNRRTGELTPNDAFFNILRSMDLSLSPLKDFTHGSIVCNPTFGKLRRSPEDSKSRKVFVLMPFTESLLPLYQDHIKPTVERMGLTCMRADDFFSADSIMDSVWEAIRDADYLVADCTGRNPNVFYEIGIAHTLGKTVVLISQSIDDIPFDIRHRRNILYEFTPRGIKQFEESLTKTLDWEARRAAASDERPIVDWRRHVRDAS